MVVRIVGELLLVQRQERALVAGRREEQTAQLGQGRVVVVFIIRARHAQELLDGLGRVRIERMGARQRTHELERAPDLGARGAGRLRAAFFLIELDEADDVACQVRRSLVARGDGDEQRLDVALGGRRAERRFVVREQPARFGDERLAVRGVRARREQHEPHPIEQQDRVVRQALGGPIERVLHTRRGLLGGCLDPLVTGLARGDDRAHRGGRETRPDVWARERLAERREVLGESLVVLVDMVERRLDPERHRQRRRQVVRLALERVEEASPHPEEERPGRREQVRIVERVRQQDRQVVVRPRQRGLRRGRVRVRLGQRLVEELARRRREASHTFGARGEGELGGEALEGFASGEDVHVVSAARGQFARAAKPTQQMETPGGALKRAAFDAERS